MRRSHTADRNTHIISLLLLVSPLLILSSLVYIGLLFGFVEFFPFCAEEFSYFACLGGDISVHYIDKRKGKRLTKPSIGILSLDPLPPVLREEHVGG